MEQHSDYIGRMEGRVYGDRVMSRTQVFFMGSTVLVFGDGGYYRAQKIQLCGGMN